MYGCADHGVVGVGFSMRSKVWVQTGWSVWTWVGHKWAWMECEEENGVDEERMW